LEGGASMTASREFPEPLLAIPDLLELLPKSTRKLGGPAAGATLGRDGVLAWDGTQFHYCPAFRVDTVDTTGAGDVFHAGFAYALLRGDALPAILEFSCAAAGLNCTAPGARGGIRPVSEIDKLRREGARRERLYGDEQLRLAASLASGTKHSSSKK